VLVTTCGGANNGGTTTTTTNGETTSTTLGAASYQADLTGTDAVPPVETSSTGTFLMSYDPETGKLTYSLEVQALDNPSVATIYEGAPGDSGTAVYTLFAGPAEQAGYSGVLAQGTIDVASLTGSLRGKTLGDLVAMVKDGNAYVSVGTTANPVDAIRGQISESTSTTTVSDGTSSSGVGDTTTTAKRTTTTKKSTTSTTKKKTTTS
jgi:CHRD domain